MKEKFPQKTLLNLILNTKKPVVLSYDWPKVIEEAQREGLTGLLFYNLKQKKFSGILNLVPFRVKEVREKLEELYFNQFGQNMLLMEEAKRILKVFKEENIEVILLKGIHLQFLYAQSGLRPMTDIDFFIKKRDFDKAEKILKNLGFNNSCGYREDFFKDKLMVDLHTDLINANRVNVRSTIASEANRSFFQEAIDFKLDGQQIKILNIYDEIIYLCAHLFFHHGLRRLIWFFDIKLLIEKSVNFDWNKLFERALSFGLEKPLFICLLLTKAELGLEMPDEFLKKQKQIKINKIEKRIYDSLSCGKGESAFRYLFTFFMLEGLKRKIIFLKELLFPNAPLLKVLYSKGGARSLGACYYQHIKNTTQLALKTLKTIL